MPVALIFILMITPLFSLFAETSEFEFSHESQLSAVHTGGNSDLETYNANMKNTARKGKNKYRVLGHYTYGKSQEVLSARNWSALARYDRFTSETLSIFLSEEVEGDKFQGLEYRYNTDLGVSYTFYETDKSSLLGEVGYRYTYEKSTDPTIGTEGFHKGRVYAEHETELREGISTRFWVEYIPNFSESEDFIIRFEPSLRVALNKIFSLSVAYRGNYDNDPSAPGLKKYDYTYTTSLIAQF